MARNKFDREESSPVAVVQNKPFLFIDYRVDRSTVPEELYMYEIADGDGDGCFARIQEGVLVNFWGTLIGPAPLELDECGSIPAYYPNYGSYEYEGELWYDEELDDDQAAIARLIEAYASHPEWFHSDNEITESCAVLPGHKYRFEGSLRKKRADRSSTPTPEAVNKFIESVKESMPYDGMKVESVEVDDHYKVTTVFTTTMVVRHAVIRDIHMSSADEQALYFDAPWDGAVNIDKVA